jgi:hypothetical protein
MNMKSSMATRAGVLILASLTGVPLVALAQANVSDTTFANADWTLTIFPGGNGGTVTASQSTVGPNFIRSVSDTVNSFQSIILGTHIYGPFTYNPGTSGAIASLSYSENAICLSGCFGNGQSTGPAILQGGNLYVYTGVFFITGPSTSFHPLSLSGLTAADFARVLVTGTTYFDNTQHPDFSGAGGPIQVGFFRANGALVSGGYTLVAGIDDWQVTINPVGITAGVPTLSPFAMGGLALLLAVAGILFLRRP